MTHESRETSAEPGPGHAPSLPCRMPAQCSASLRLFPAVNRTGTLPGRAAGTKRLLLGARATSPPFFSFLFFNKEHMVY